MNRQVTTITYLLPQRIVYNTVMQLAMRRPRRRDAWFLLWDSAYFLGANDPYKSLKTEIDEDSWSTLNSNTSRPFPKPASGRIAVKVINHLGDEVMKVFKVD